MKFDKRIIIVFAIICVVLFMFSSKEKELLLGSGDKSEIKTYIRDNRDTLDEKAFRVYGRFKALTSDKDIHRQVLEASKEKDVSKLESILDNL